MCVCVCEIYVDSRLGKFCLWFLACGATGLTLHNCIDALLVRFPASVSVVVVVMVAVLMLLLRWLLLLLC